MPPLPQRGCSGRGCRKGVAYDLDLGVAPNNEIGFGDPHQEAYWLGRLSRLAQNRPAENYINRQDLPRADPWEAILCLDVLRLNIFTFGIDKILLM